jgi:hypothetical protein
VTGKHELERAPRQTIDRLGEVREQNPQIGCSIGETGVWEEAAVGAQAPRSEPVVR